MTNNIYGSGGNVGGGSGEKPKMVTIFQEESKRLAWEEIFEKGFSFEGDNDPNSTPKMMFVNLHDNTKTLARPEYFKAFIREVLSEREEEIIKERDLQIRNWFKIPIKKQFEEGKIGPIICDMCGGQLFNIRGRYPKEPTRIVCPTCAIEIIESISGNLYPNNQACSELLALKSK